VLAYFGIPNHKEVLNKVFGLLEIIFITFKKGISSGAIVIKNTAAINPTFLGLKYCCNLIKNGSKLPRYLFYNTFAPGQEGPVQSN